MVVDGSALERPAACGASDFWMRRNATHLQVRLSGNGWQAAVTVADGRRQTRGERLSGQSATRTSGVEVQEHTGETIDRG